MRGEGGTALPQAAPVRPPRQSLDLGLRRRCRLAGAALALALAAAAAHAQEMESAPQSAPVKPPPSAPEAPPPSAAASAESTASGILGLFDIRNSPFIPVPEVATDPNAGTAFGILPVYLVTNDQKEISRIYAPDILYSPTLGYGGNFRVFGYPSTDTEWYVVAGAMEHVERGFDALYTTGITRTGPWSLSGRAVYDRSATGRFFGVGNDTVLGDRTNFTEEQAYFNADLGWNVTRQLQAQLQLRPRSVQIEPGTLERSIDPSQLGTENDFLNRLVITWDTRDSTVIPTRGLELAAFGGVSDRGFLSTISYTELGLDARHLLPIDDRFTLASHASLRYMPGSGDIPFWALSSLGGDRSIIGERQPLRGFGEGRFLDRNMFSGSLELRTRVFDLNLFSQTLTFEAAPFIDTGQVFHRMSESPVSRLHYAGGIGLRGIAHPFIVGYVDIGYGDEGVAIFSGINYPF